MITLEEVAVNEKKIVILSTNAEMTRPLIHSLLEEHHFDSAIRLLDANPGAAKHLDDKGVSPLQLSFRH